MSRYLLLTGYLLQFEVCLRNQWDSEIGLGEQVVTSLVTHNDNKEYWFHCRYL